MVKTRALQAAQVSVAFKDTGEGMSSEQQQRAFKTVLSSTKAKGTGIGLAIVGRVIETHRGQIRISSRPGRGTTMRITLPVQ
jgi:signal transduction histidine kinase